jgi:type II secretory pathway component PulF
MFVEFELEELPAVTAYLITASTQIVNYGPLAVLLSCVIVLVGVGSTLYCLGWLPWNAPGVGWLRLPYDRTVLLRVLAMSVRRGIPFEFSLETLEGLFPVKRTRFRILRALGKMRRGSEWHTALRQAGLITVYEQAVLAAAQRVGNLPWALEAMAETARRRLATRLRTAIGLATGIGFASYSLLVLWIAAGVLAPLANLILRLT